MWSCISPPYSSGRESTIFTIQEETKVQVGSQKDLWPEVAGSGFQPKGLVHKFCSLPTKPLSPLLTRGAVALNTWALRAIQRSPWPRAVHALPAPADTREKGGHEHKAQKGQGSWSSAGSQVGECSPQDEKSAPASLKESRPLCCGPVRHQILYSPRPWG